MLCMTITRTCFWRPVAVRRNVRTATSGCGSDFRRKSELVVVTVMGYTWWLLMNRISAISALGSTAFMRSQSKRCVMLSGMFVLSSAMLTVLSPLMGEAWEACVALGEGFEAFLETYLPSSPGQAPRWWWQVPGVLLVLVGVQRIRVVGREDFSRSATLVVRVATCSTSVGSF